MKNNHPFILVLFISLSFNLAAQTTPDSWDKNYPAINFEELIEFENQYANSINKNPKATKYYTRVNNVKFPARYLGEKRPLDASRLKSMKRVFKLYLGNPSQLDKLVENEYKFQVGKYEYWFPMQVSLEKDFKKEIKKNKSVNLYCLFMNEHSTTELFNIFLISEFRIPSNEQ